MPDYKLISTEYSPQELKELIANMENFERILKKGDFISDQTLRRRMTI